MTLVLPKAKTFELPGSKPHYPPSIFFNIEYMWLSVEPDFLSKAIRCKQQLKLLIRQDINKLELDAAKLKIESVFLSSGAAVDLGDKANIDTSPTGHQNIKELSFKNTNEKLFIEIGKALPEGSRVNLIIRYSANPERGFYFVNEKENPSHKRQAWTQGEMEESKFWFPCVDHPQMKFPREISITVPDNFIAISNGDVDLIDSEFKTKRKFVWEEPNPTATYLTAIIIGEFTETSKGEVYKNRVPLRYYVPKERAADADRTFKDTPKMMEYLEKYLGLEYPYSKYSQIVIEDFPYGGMENANCTTLYTDVLHDERAHMDYTSDDVVVHELTHHWFGDLVTCRDWQHVWLNEGFASYFEALYFENFYSPNPEEFYYYILQKADSYLDEANNLYKRPLVTKVYDHPDEMFDVGHTYDKGACVLHMIRNYIGDDDFRKSLKVYLETYKNKTAETANLRQVFEDISGKSLEQFFDQWLYRAGHPVVDVEISPKDSKTLDIKITQRQKDNEGKLDLFDFPLESRIVLLFSDGSEESVVVNFNVTEEITLKTFDMSNLIDRIRPSKGDIKNIKWVSIDPEFKILKEINSISTPIEMLLFQLQEGKTVIERIQAARSLGTKHSNQVIDALKSSVIQDDFWGVSAESAASLGLAKDTQFAEKAYDALMECLSPNSKITNPKVKDSLINALGGFRRANSFQLLERVLDNSNNESYFVMNSAATAIGATGNKTAIPKLQHLLETQSFLELVARGALSGLTTIAVSSKDDEVVRMVRDLLLEKTKYGYDQHLRRTATRLLGQFVREGEGEENINTTVYNRLKELLFDDWVHVRNVACIALGDAFKGTNYTNVIQALEKVAEYDSDGQVRRTALESIRKVKEEVKKQPPMRMITIQDLSKLDLSLRSQETRAMQKRIPTK